MAWSSSDSVPTQPSSIPRASIQSTAFKSAEFLSDLQTAMASVTTTVKVPRPDQPQQFGDSISSQPIHRSKKDGGRRFYQNALRSEII